MIQHLALEAPQGLAMFRAAGEHQGRPRRGVHPEHGEHAPLIVVAQVEQAVPGEDAVERLAKGQDPHVGDAPGLLRHALPAMGDHFRRRIHAGEGAAALDDR